MSKAWVVGCVVVAAFGIALVLLGDAREQMIVGQGLLPVNFAHKDHSQQSCLQCHHNFVDSTGSLPCLECHKTDPQVQHLVEAQFHDLCRGCHMEQQLLGEAAGPVRQCVDCHQLDPYP